MPHPLREFLQTWQRSWRLHCEQVFCSCLWSLWVFSDFHAHDIILRFTWKNTSTWNPETKYSLHTFYFSGLNFSLRIVRHHNFSLLTVSKQMVRTLVLPYFYFTFATIYRQHQGSLPFTSLCLGKGSWVANRLTLCFRVCLAHALNNWRGTLNKLSDRRKLEATYTNDFYRTSSPQPVSCQREFERDHVVNIFVDKTIGQ